MKLKFFRGQSEGLNAVEFLDYIDERVVLSLKHGSQREKLAGKIVCYVMLSAILGPYVSDPESRTSLRYRNSMWFAYLDRLGVHLELPDLEDIYRNRGGANVSVPESVADEVFEYYSNRAAQILTNHPTGDFWDLFREAIPNVTGFVRAFSAAKTEERDGLMRLYWMASEDRPGDLELIGRVAEMTNRADLTEDYLNQEFDGSSDTVLNHS